jgi:hypothetical protein
MILNISDEFKSWMIGKGHKALTLQIIKVKSG